MKKLTGWILLLISATIVLGGFAREIGLLTTLLIVGCAVALAGLISTGIYLIMDES